MLPAAFVFCLGVNWYLEGEPLRARQGSSHVLGVATWQGPAGGTMLPHRPLLIILRVMAAGSSYTTHCSKIPQQVPQNQSSPVMNKFCFQLGLTRHSTARPIPAPEHSPAKKLPKVIAPPIYS